jgi:hypothetical protein
MFFKGERNVLSKKQKGERKVAIDYKKYFN